MTRTILLVDDNEVNLKLARAILTACGYEVVEAATGGQALAIAQAQPPALILLDMQLPDLDGLEVLAQLRTLPEMKDVPIVAMTAQAMVGDRQRFLAAGCDGYISKPISVRTFALEVERYFARGSKEAAGS